MNTPPDHDLLALLQQVRDGQLAPAEALTQLASARPAGDLGFATVDHDRARRCGFPEVVFCQGKTPADAARIAAEILRAADRCLLTRATAEHAAAVQALLPQAHWHERARCITIGGDDTPGEGLVAVVCAGTADLPVADEAAVTLRLFGNRVAQFTDVGVAGLHRLLARLPEIRQAQAIVAVAGMEGALPSVLAGLVDRPVFAVPTSIGYGANFGGLTALLSMLNSCAAGVAVVNIDNGFGAGYLASLVNRRRPTAATPTTTPPRAAR